MKNTIGSRSVFGRVAVAPLLVAAIVALAACSENPVGRKCDLGQTTGVGEAIMGSPSLDCESRTCLKIPVAANKETPEGFEPLASNIGLCTATCESSDDCDAVPKTPCKTGFTCGIALTVGPFCCQKYCICKDYVILPESGALPTPAACIAENDSNICCNLPNRAGNPAYPNCP